MYNHESELCLVTHEWEDMKGNYTTEMLERLIALIEVELRERSLKHGRQENR